MSNNSEVKLRVPEVKDAPQMLLWENDTDFWRVSGTEAPFSLLEIENFIMSASKVRENKQLRFIIVDQNNNSVGLIDLYNINFKHSRGGVGVLIANDKDRGRGYAKKAIDLLIKFAVNKLNIRNFYANIQSDNEKSVRLFESLDFIKVGEKKDWYIFPDEVLNEYIYQRIVK